jgi:hypothetical protein
MIEVKNKKNYHKSLLQTTLWILAGFVITLFLNPSFFAGSVIICIIIELIFLSERFTQSVSVDNINATIIYYHFLSKKEIVIKKGETKSKLSKAGSFRSPVYWILDIIQHNKRIYRIDSRDGFDEDDLIMIDNNLKTSN